MVSLLSLVNLNSKLPASTSTADTHMADQYVGVILKTDSSSAYVMNGTLREWTCPLTGTVMPIWALLAVMSACLEVLPLPT